MRYAIVNCFGEAFASKEMTSMRNVSGIFPDWIIYNWFFHGRSFLGPPKIGQIRLWRNLGENSTISKQLRGISRETERETYQELKAKLNLMRHFHWRSFLGSHCGKLMKIKSNKNKVDMTFQKFFNSDDLYRLSRSGAHPTHLQREKRSKGIPCDEDPRRKKHGVRNRAQWHAVVMNHCEVTQNIYVCVGKNAKKEWWGYN